MPRREPLRWSKAIKHGDKSRLIILQSDEHQLLVPPNSCNFSLGNAEFFTLLLMNTFCYHCQVNTFLFGEIWSRLVWYDLKCVCVQQSYSKNRQNCVWLRGFHPPKVTSMIWVVKPKIIWVVALLAFNKPKHSKTVVTRLGGWQKILMILILMTIMIYHHFSKNS